MMPGPPNNRRMVGRAGIERGELLFFELQFVCKGGKRGADVRPDFTGRLKASQAARSSCQDFIFQMWKVS